jgi:heme/copper-type cytochrome/quinol oxidase subunit 2
MQGQVIVVSQQEYDAMKRDKPGGAAPTTAPAVAMND